MVKKNKKLKLSSLPKTWFIDVDGTMLKHNGHKKENGDELLPGVKKFFYLLSKRKSTRGDVVVLTTSRSGEDVKKLQYFLGVQGIIPSMILSINPGERILINDMKPSGLKTAYAINKVRDAKFEIEYEIDESL